MDGRGDQGEKKKRHKSEGCCYRTGDDGGLDYSDNGDDEKEMGWNVFWRQG